MTEPIAFTWVDSDSELDSIIDVLLDEPRYAIDTEFHREKSYFPKLALVQLAWPDSVVLVDPLALDITALRRLFESDTEAIFHAAQQDLDVLTHAVGAVPRHFFDTQIAGSFLGYGTPSLVALLGGELGVHPPKSDRLTDWLRRPLTANQLQYAAADVAYLLELTDRLQAQLREANRIEWVRDACRELAERPVSGTAPENAWLRLKDARGLNRSARAVAQSVAAWREHEAMRRDIPARQVLPDLAVLAISQRRPSNPQQLKSTRGVDDRINRSGVAEAVLDAINVGLANDPPERPVSGDELARDLRPAVTLISAWVSQVAKQQRVDTALLATRADLVDFLSERDDARLGSGWRKEVLGDDIDKLLSGAAALTFDKANGLRLVDVGADVPADVNVESVADDSASR